MQMLRLILFAVVMLALSGLCNGQGRTGFGSTRAQDTSFTKGQLKLEAYSGSGDTTILVLMPNGDVKKVAKTAFGGSYTGGYGIDISGNVVAIDTLVVTQWSDTLSVLATKGDIAGIPVLDTSSLSARIDSLEADSHPIPRYASDHLIFDTFARENNVIILSGQSNALGQFPDTALAYLPTEYNGAQSKIKVWWTGESGSPEQGHFEDMLVPYNTRDSIYTNPASIPDYYITGWGVEQSAMRKIQGVINDTTYLLKSTLGGRNITFWLPPSGTQWLKLQQYITESADSLDAKGVPVNYRAFIWLQGESDALENIEALYEGRLRTFIAAWRALDDRLDSTLFVMVKLKAGTISQSKVDVINAAFDQMAAESPFNVTVDPNAVGVTLFDGLHYGRSYFRMGNAIADTIIAHTMQQNKVVNIEPLAFKSITTSAAAPFNFKVLPPSLTAPTLYLSHSTGYASLHSSTVGNGLTFTGTLLTNNATTGISGGQTLHGGTALGDDLNLRSTTNTITGGTYIRNISNGVSFGIASVDPLKDVHVQHSLDRATGIRVENLSTGTAARAEYELLNNNGDAARIILPGTGYTTVGLLAPKNFYLTVSGGGSAVLNSATGNVYLATANTERLRVNASGSIFLSSKIAGYNNAAPTNGQLLIGHTANGTFEAATLTAGTNISVTNGAGSVTIGTSATPTFTNITLSGIQEFADNAAALSGGLTVGQPYRTGDNLKIVH